MEIKAKKLHACHFSTLIRIAKTEAKIIWRRAIARILLAALLLLSSLSGYLSSERNDREQKRQVTFDKIVREQWEQQPDRHPHRVAHYGSFAFKPRSPMAAYDPGIELYTGRMLYLEAHRQNGMTFSEASTLSSLAVLGELSPAVAIEWSLPLITILLGYGIFASEIESNRHALLRSTNINRFTHLLGKWLGLLFATLPYYIISILVIWTIITYASRDSPAIEWKYRFIILTSLLALYQLIWVSITLCISRFSRYSSMALSVLMMLWLLFTIITPRVTAAYATTKYPLLDKSQFQAKINTRLDRLGDSHNPEDPAFVKFREDILKRHHVNSIEELPFNYKGALMAKGEEQTAQAFAEELKELRTQEDHQHHTVSSCSWLSPALIMRRLSMRLCGTDTQNQRAFEDQSEAYRYSFIQKLNKLQVDHISFHGNSTERLKADHWKAFEHFHMQPETINSSDFLKTLSPLIIWLLSSFTGLLLISKNL